MTEYLHRVKFLIKHLLAYCLYYTGLLLAIKTIKFRNRAIVLMYHRILPSADRVHSFSHSAIMVEPVNFERHITFLKHHFNILSSEEFSQRFSNRIAFDNASCLITFDDGWQDNYQYAFPILKTHNVPALIFPATDYTGSGMLFWQEAMGHGFYQLLNLETDDARQLLREHGIDTLKEQPAELQIDRIRQYVRDLKSLSYEQIFEIINHQESILGNIDFGKIDRYLDWEQIVEMHKAGIEFGSHACSHRILTRLENDEISAELKRSRQLLADAINSDIKTIAYPNGNFDDRLGELTLQAGYEIGFGTEFGSVSHIDNAFNIKRINVNDMTSSNNPIMLATILGLF